MYNFTEIETDNLKTYKTEMQLALEKIALDAYRYFDTDWRQRVFILDKMDLPEEFFTAEDLAGKGIFDKVLPCEQNAFSILGKLIIFDQAKPPSKDQLDFFKQYMLRHYKFFPANQFSSRWLYETKVTKPLDVQIDGDKSFLHMVGANLNRKEGAAGPLLLFCLFGLHFVFEFFGFSI